MRRQHSKESVGFMWKLINGEDFVKLKMCVDNVMKEKAEKELGSLSHSDEAFDHADIDKLWDDGFLGQSNQKQ